MRATPVKGMRWYATTPVLYCFRCESIWRSNVILAWKNLYRGQRSRRPDMTFRIRQPGLEPAYWPMKSSIISWCNVRRTELPNLREALEWAEKCIKPDGTIAVYLENRSAEDYEGNFSIELAQSVQNLLPVNWLGLRLNASFAGGQGQAPVEVAGTISCSALCGLRRPQDCRWRCLRDCCGRRSQR